MSAGPRSNTYQYGSINHSSQEKKHRSINFKYLYFTIQKLINSKVKLSLRYELLKTPEIHSSITKPISTEIIKLASVVTPPKSNPIWMASTTISESISQYAVFILLLLRYEFIIQSENNLISFELLSTKANICEILAIRMLREYKSYERVNMLFIKPLGQDQFNTLELSILSKSKKFLSQPIIIQTMDKIYNGDITIKTHDQENLNNDSEQQLLSSDNVSNYQFKRITMSLIKRRSEIVPKYQSLVINLKLIMLTILYFMLILKHKHQVHGTFINLLEVQFWLLALNYNYENFIKLNNIRFKFLRKILWTYIDLILILMLDFVGLIRLSLFLGGSGISIIEQDVFRNLFSIISIVLLPRILSIFNNYEFFNMIILSFKRMVWKMIGLFCLFISLISGFYISFISLSIDRPNSMILFDMLKVFFGFTPAIWDNWGNYNNLGRVTQLGYLFLVQFVIATILAIVLSEVFNKISATNKEEFHYFKATNIVIYQQTSKIFMKRTYKWNNENPLYTNLVCEIIWKFSLKAFAIINWMMDLFKFPILLLIYLYELSISQLIRRDQKDKESKKNFTFLKKEMDYESDINRFDDDSADIFHNKGGILGRKASFGREHSSVRKHSLTNDPSGIPAGNSLIPIQSISTLGNFKSASTDSLFIDEMLHRRYGQNEGVNVFDSIKTETKRLKDRTYKDVRNETEIMEKLLQIETLFSEVVNRKEKNLREDQSQGEGEGDDDEEIQSVKTRLTSDNDNLGDIYNIPEASLSEVSSVTSIGSISDVEDDEV
ncbi:hypothetical protein CAAN3_01S13498 [[Candida] anglica]